MRWRTAVGVLTRPGSNDVIKETPTGAGDGK